MKHLQVGLYNLTNVGIGIYKIKETKMPSKSIAQLRLMRMAYAYKKGKLNIKPSQEIIDIANSMTFKELQDYIKTPKDKNLPMHIDEEFATLASTPGMGAVTAPTATTTGSGDSFNSYGLYTQGFLKKTKKDRKSKKTDPMKHYHPEKGVVHFQPHGSILRFEDFIKNLQTRDKDDFSDHNDGKDTEGVITASSSFSGPELNNDGGFED